MNNIILKNKHFRLVIDADARAESLVILDSGEELLFGERLPMFSVTQERPYNNENKLIYMNKRTTFFANRVKMEEDKLIVGFDLAPYEAIVGCTVKEEYIAFTLKEFIVHPEDYDYLKMNTPPAVEFRICALPIKKKERYGKWLNVMWDDESAVALLGTSSHTRIDSKVKCGGRVFTADAVNGIRLLGAGAVLIVTKSEMLLDVIDRVERDYGMPLGVASRRGEYINSSIYWTTNINPENVDEHIALMKKGGFKLALFYYKTFFSERLEDFSACSDYNFRHDYPGGFDSLDEVIDKVRAAGIVPGLHILHTHIGLETSYVTPKADRRLNITNRFTLSRPLGIDDDVVYVDQNPDGAAMHPDCRLLAFMGEIISYEAYSTEPPYRFLGCKRGACNTEVIDHRAGEIGGVLDVSEFGATSVYLDQNTDLQDEIAEKIAEVYSHGFEFIYFDGSEGVNPPFEFHVPNAQYRVYKRLPGSPIFCEGAAKAHFSWHMLSGANAFDIFPTSSFKEMIDRFPVVDAKEMKNDLTRVNFGWWEMYPDTRADVYEYGLMRATAWDCPAAVMVSLDRYKGCSQADSALEVVRRWEDAKEKGFFTEDKKAYMRKHNGEMLLFINENKEYELLECRQIASVENVFAFLFTRGDKSYVSICKIGSEGRLYLPLSTDRLKYFSDNTGEEYVVEAFDTGSVISVGKRLFICAECDENTLAAAISKARIIL